MHGVYWDIFYFHILHHSFHAIYLSPMYAFLIAEMLLLNDFSSLASTISANTAQVTLSWFNVGPLHAKLAQR